MRALVTGATGQIGSYLCEHLLAQGYKVCGLIRGQANPKRDDLERLVPGVRMIEGDLTDLSSLITALEQSAPVEVYNLGAVSHVGFSFAHPELTADVTGVGALRMLEACRIVNPKIRFYQASSSEMFGSSAPPQHEDTPFHPRSPYGVAKVYAHYMVQMYREAYGMFCCSGISFNQESPRRGREFVTRKITEGVAKIEAGLIDTIPLGNLEAVRDWGFAGDYVIAMHKMLQRGVPSDYVLATGVSHTVREFLRYAFREIGVEDWRPYVVIDPTYMRPAEVDELIGDSSRAQYQLDWRPQVMLPELVKAMVQNDREIIQWQTSKV